MTKELSAFHPIEGFENIHTAQKGALRCVAIKLATGGVCIYSPVQGLGHVARESLQAIGNITHLLAPNHYHHKGIEEFQSTFPDAVLCCTSGAAPRLLKQTGMSCDNIDSAGIELTAGMRFTEPKGLKTGEVWVQIFSEDNVLWVVTDAFCGAKGPVGAVVQTPELLGTFPRYGIQDRDMYSDWLSGQIEANAPNTIVPCHGSLISGSGIGDVALQLVKNL